MNEMERFAAVVREDMDSQGMTQAALDALYVVGGPGLVVGDRFRAYVC